MLPFGIPFAVGGLALALFSPWWLLVPGALAVLAVAYGTAIAVAVPVDHREPRRLRLRALVGAFHVLQPLVRAWGRITGRKAATPETQAPAWAGDRLVWLDDLTAALEREGCTVKPGGPGDSWDIMATSGLMTSARITTAVAWKWEPRSHVSYRARLLLWALAAAGAAVGTVAAPWGWAVAGASVLGLAGSVLALRHRVRRAVERTTLGAGL